MVNNGNINVLRTILNAPQTNDMCRPKWFGAMLTNSLWSAHKATICQSTPHHFWSLVIISNDVDHRDINFDIALRAAMYNLPSLVFLEELERELLLELLRT
jgi:hypothetical protein